MYIPKDRATYTFTKIFFRLLVDDDNLNTCIVLCNYYAYYYYLNTCMLALSPLHWYRFDHISHSVPDIYADTALLLDLFDIYDYPQARPLSITMHKKKNSFFKDELNSKPAYEFVERRAKIYYLLSSDSEKKTAKKVSRSVVSKKIKHEHYKEALFNQYQWEQFNTESKVSIIFYIRSSNTTWHSIH